MHKILTQVKLGVISGAGPEAGVDLLNKVIVTHRQKLGAKYRNDRDAPYVMLLQVPGIGGPRNPLDLFEEDKEPFKLVWAALTQAIDDMITCKIDTFCISCNTLHVLQERILAYIQDKPIKFISMIECVASALVATSTTNARKVAIFGTFTTTDIQGNSPYKQLAQAHELIELPKETRGSLQNMIADVKKRGADKVEPEMLKNLETLIEETDSDVFIFACTELPLIMHRLKVSTGKTLIDPGLCLCEELLMGAGLQLRRRALALPFAVPAVPAAAGDKVTEAEVKEAQTAWASAIKSISKAYLDKKDFVDVAATAAGQLYGYGKSNVLFKPTKAAEYPFRPTAEEAMSYFVGEKNVKDGYKEDGGFAINGGKGWKDVVFDNHQIELLGNTAIAMGSYVFTCATTGDKSKVEYTFGYKRVADGKLRIFLHHSSVPFALLYKNKSGISTATCEGLS